MLELTSTEILGPIVFGTSFAVCDVATSPRASNGEVGCSSPGHRRSSRCVARPWAEVVTCVRLPPATQISLAAVHQRRSIKDVLSSCGPSCRDGRTVPLVGRVVRSKMFFLLKKKEHRDHTTRHRLGVERPSTPEKTHRDQNEDCDASLMNCGQADF